MPKLAFSYADLYPAMGGVETSNLATPEAEDQAAMTEDNAVSEKVDPRTPGTKNILIALGLVSVLAVVFGVSK